MANNSNDIFMKTLGIGGPFAIGGGIAALGKNVGACNARIAAQKAIANGITNPANFPKALPYGPLGATQGINMSGGIPYGAVSSAKFGVQNFNMLGSPTGTVFTGVGRPSLGVTPGMELAAFQNPAANLAGRYPGYYGSSAPVVGGSGLPAGLETSSFVTRYPGSAGASPLGVGDTVSVAGRGGIPAMPAGVTGGGVPGGGVNAAGASPYGRIASQVGSAGESAAASEGAGLLARLGYAPSGVGRMGAFVRPGLTGLGAAGILSAGLAGGTLAGAGLGALNLGGKESAVDRFVTGAGFGAPVGAAIGNVIPIPVVGAGIGALAGGAIGGVGNVVRGIFEDSDKADMNRSNQKRMNRIDSLFETAGLTPNQMAQYRAQFDTGMLNLGDNPKPSDVAALLTQLETQVQKTAGTNAGKLTGKDMVALQAAIGQYMQPLVQQQQQSGQLAANMYNQMAGNMNNSALADQMRAQAANAQAQSDRMTAAYMGQAQSIPALYGLQQLGQLANQQQSTKSATLAEQLVANGAG